MTSRRPAPQPKISFTPGTSLFENRTASVHSETEIGARLFTDPVGTIAARKLEDVPTALADLESAIGQGYWAAGYLTFEAGYGLEPKLSAQYCRPSRSTAQQAPLIRFTLHKRCQSMSHQAIDMALLCSLEGGHVLSPPRPRLTEVAYKSNVERALAYIRAGDIYQANLTFPLDAMLKGSPLSLYTALRASQPVGQGGFVCQSDDLILSVSPELFVEKSADALRARPMKGTRSRGGDIAADKAAATALRNSGKDCAENLMIVDLLRNDLSRVCRPGSVHVPRLFELESYPTFHALTSTIEGSVRPGVGLSDTMFALFPCGSITGAPKVRAMEIIQELENYERGPYTGAMGWIAPDGDFSFNVGIRTMTVDAAGRITYPVGAGIVADSDPTAEFAECLLKAKVLQDEAKPFDLIETLHWDQRSGFAYLDLHMDRLHASADWFGYPYVREEIEAALNRAVQSAGPTAFVSPQRVRLLLDRLGQASVTVSPLTEVTTSGCIQFVLAEDHVDGANPYLRHKTTRREPYDRALEDARAKGASEVLFCNQYGELTEGAWTNLFLRRGPGPLLTPPVSSGLLPGVLRADLIAKGEAVEHVLTPDDLAGDGEVLLGNSVRGLMPATLVRVSTSKPANASA